MSAGPGVLNATYVEALYERFRRDPDAVPGEWRELFDALESAPPSPATGTDSREARQDAVDSLVRAFRARGHLSASDDPLGASARPPDPELDPASYGLGKADLERPFSAASIGDGGGTTTLREILARMRATYCGSIGVEFVHIHEAAPRHWLRERMERTANRIALSRGAEERLLRRLVEASVFEEFVQKKWLGAKTFSLEGAETLLPLLELALEKAGGDGVEEVVIAMSHRGRLNVLVNLMGKPPRDLFREFEESEGALPYGDVKYHLGYSHDWITAAGAKLHVSLCFNPSHLEYVNPVALGRVRAKQDQHRDAARTRGMALLVHGDAAFAGEGIVQETLNLSRLEGYAVGGALHVIVDNRIGFTTPPEQARSTVYATDVAKMLQSPIFHVNGEDAAAVAAVLSLSMDFRREFRRDVVINLFCYRRRGHNESDEPAFTQPLLYERIRRTPPVRETFVGELAARGRISVEMAERMAREQHDYLEAELRIARRTPAPAAPPLAGGSIWSGFAGGRQPAEHPRTGVARDTLESLLARMTEPPEDFHAHPKILRAMQRRRAAASRGGRVDWATAEALAFASLAREGHRVRLTGQDAERGTFSQRHAVLHDVENGAIWRPLSHVASAQAAVEIVNSPLSEAGALGFEYGYSLDYPQALVLWEAQYGDFVNAAQVIVDQFIASAAEKWKRLSGLVLLLPHGLEGMGPEHSSARPERFLGLAAGDNLQLCAPSTAAQYFHLLRRQVLRRWRAPLVVLTPKSLLRREETASPLDDLVDGSFQRVRVDAENGARSSGRRVERVLLCSGKIGHELSSAARAAAGELSVAIVRLEQIYPLDEKALLQALARFPDAPAVWVQEEPRNMGVWPWLRWRFGDRLPDGRALTVVARPPSASPAPAVSSHAHAAVQRRLIATALAGTDLTRETEMRP